MKFLSLLITTILTITAPRLSESTEQTCTAQKGCDGGAKGDTESFFSFDTTHKIDNEQLNQCMKEAYNAVQEMKGKPVYLFAGYTGECKSTDIAYLAGYKMIKKKDPETGIEYVDVEEGKGPGIATAETSFQSKTKYPELFTVLNNEFEDFCFVDLPGFGDTGSIADKICAYISMKVALENLKVRGLIVAISEDGLAVKGESFKKTIKILNLLLDNPLRHMENIYFLFNKFPDDITTKEIRVRLNLLSSSSGEANKEVKRMASVIAKSPNIFMINPLDGGTSRKEINEKLEPKEGFISSSSFHFAADDTTLLIVKNWIKNATIPSYDAYHAILQKDKERKEKQKKIDAYNMPITEGWEDKSWKKQSEEEWKILREQKSALMEIKRIEIESIENDVTPIPYKKTTHTYKWEWAHKCKWYNPCWGCNDKKCNYKGGTKNDVGYDEQCNAEEIPNCNLGCGGCPGTRSCTKISENKPKNEHPCFVNMLNKLMKEKALLSNHIAVIDLKEEIYELLFAKQSYLDKIEANRPNFYTVDYLDQMMNLSNPKLSYGKKTLEFLRLYRDTDFYTYICSEK